MNLKDLWIGDPVRIVTSGKEGTFEGISSDGRARVKYRDKILLTREHNLQLYTPSQPSKLEQLKYPTTTTPQIKNPIPSNRLDLHIDVLNPALSNEVPQIILNHQLKRCKAFLENSILLKIPIITIIHGKGTGALKQEVLHLISSYPEIRHTIPQHDGGAIEVWIR